MLESFRGRRMRTMIFCIIAITLMGCAQSGKWALASDSEQGVHIWRLSRETGDLDYCHLESGKAACVRFPQQSENSK